MKKVLLIDDDPIFLKTVAEALKPLNYTIITANDGKEGLKIAKEEKPNIILLDVLMSDTGGMKFLAMAKEDPEISNIPVIIASNLTSMSNVDEGLKLGARGYIIKSDESLKTIVDTVASIVSEA